MKNDAVFLTGVCHPNSFNRAQGAYRLAHVLRSDGYKVRVIDGLGSLPYKNIIAMIEATVSNKTKLVGISSSFLSNFVTSVHSDSLVTTDFLPYQYDEWMSIINTIKKKSNAKIVVGGHKTNEFESQKDLHNYIDHFIYGYSDNIIVSLLKDANPKIQQNNSWSINSNDFNEFDTRYDHLDSFLPGESFTIEMQRGCIFKCKFCAYPLNGKSKNSFVRNPKQIIEELKFCYENFGSTNFILNSDTFNDSEFYLNQFCDEIYKTNIKFNFSINARLDLFYNRPKLIQLCKDIGVRTVLFGLETSNPFSLKHIGKGLPFEMVVETLYKCKDIWQNQIKITGSYIIGLPFDTLKNIETVYNFFVDKNCPLDSIEFDPLYVFNTEISKNIWQSEYSNNAKKYGFEFNKSEMNWSNKNCVFENFNQCVIETEKIIKTLPAKKKGTIKSAAYMHLPNNIISDKSANEKFEEIFKLNTYSDYNDYQKSLGFSTLSAKNYTVNKYFDLFMRNNTEI